jgi:hypothetical protein
MYAGSTLKQLRTLDMWFGAHQKLDRMARRRLQTMLPTTPSMTFPHIKTILQFEGIDGPDGIKRKTPAQDEPWHFFDPHDEEDTQILHDIHGHYTSLVEALRANNQTRAGFHAAWLAHAVVDGLTPAHHYPYENELIRLRGGKGIESRTSPKEKILMPGDTVRKQLRNNWEMWGDKGLLATHLSFEIGVALLVLPVRTKTADRTPLSVAPLKKQSYRDFFLSQAQAVTHLKLYEQFYESGWTLKMANRVRRELVPIIVDTLTLIWYAAAREAQGVRS